MKRIQFFDIELRNLRYVYFLPGLKKVLPNSLYPKTVPRTPPPPPKKIKIKKTRKERKGPGPSCSEQGKANSGLTSILIPFYNQTIRIPANLLLHYILNFVAIKQPLGIFCENSFK